MWRNPISVEIVVAMFAMVSVVSTLFYIYLPIEVRGFYYLHSSDRGLISALAIILFYLFLFLLWYWVCGMFFPVQEAAKSRSFTSLAEKQYIAGLSVIGLLLCILMLGFGFGWSELGSRLNYLHYKSFFLVSVFKNLSLVAAYFCLRSWDNMNAGSKILLSLCTILLLGMYFSMGTRRFFILIIFVSLFFAPRALGKYWWLLLCLWALLLMPTMDVFIQCRGLMTHGFFPYLSFLLSDSYSFDASIAFYNALANLAIYIPLTEYVASVASFSSELFWTSINPLPGSWLGWQDESRLYNINPYQPYNAFGMLSNFGFGYMAFHALLVALVQVFFRWVSGGVTRKLSGDIGVFMMGVQPIFLVLIFMFMSQYQLRTGTRILYYQLAFSIVVCVMMLLPSNVRERK